MALAACGLFQMAGRRCDFRNPAGALLGDAAGELSINRKVTRENQNAHESPKEVRVSAFTLTGMLSYFLVHQSEPPAAACRTQRSVKVYFTL